MSEVKKKRVLRTVLLLTVCVACAAAMSWSTASASGSIQYIRTDAAAAQQATCDSQDTCLEWGMVQSNGSVTPMGIFCCGDEYNCSLVPGGNV